MALLREGATDKRVLHCALTEVTEADVRRVWSDSTTAGVEAAVQVVVPTAEEAHAMTVRQLETQLAAAGVDYSAALEKSELVEMLLSQVTLN
jgi:hypothetical protein